MGGTIRLCVDHPLGPGQTVPLDQGQANYLFAVMRLDVGADLRVFNGRDGEWRAVVREAGKRRGLLEAVEATAPLRVPSDLWLLFAPIRKTRTDFIVEKAVELGAARICPVQTAHTNADRIRRDRLQAHAVEAAEQCGAMVVPTVTDLAPLGRVLDDWPADRRLMFCDEGLAGTAAVLTDPAAALDAASTADRAADPAGPSAARVAVPGPWAILVGPEGGFAPEERARLSALPQARPVSLGPRILRADTAAVAALVLWQLTMGDWR